MSQVPPAAGGELAGDSRCRRLHALIGRGERYPHMLGATNPVEVTWRHQDTTFGEPRDGVHAGLVAGEPQIEPGLGVLHNESGLANRRHQ